MKISLILVIINIYGFKAEPKAALLAEKWEEFKVMYNKQYSDSTEEALRKQLFANRLEQIEEHNSKHEQGLVSFTIGINHLSDFTKEEIYKYTHGAIESVFDTISLNEIFMPSNLNKLPDSVDWRDEGVVPPPKNQGHCSSCWAFSTIGSLECHYRIYKRLNVSLSEQQLVDCVPKDINNRGCGGGWVDHAFEYIKANGINTEHDYPYKAEDGVCHYDSTKPHYTITGYLDIEKGNETALKAAVAEKGPVSVVIDATGDILHTYKKGVYYNPDCSPDRQTHAVVVVGYGKEDGKDYWLVKNSYGKTWGDHGYIKMARNRNNHCGIVSHASFPIV